MGLPDNETLLCIGGVVDTTKQIDKPHLHRFRNTVDIDIFEVLLGVIIGGQSAMKFCHHIAGCSFGFAFKCGKGSFFIVA